MRVLDQRGDLSEIPLPTGRAAFMERLNAVLGARADAAAAAAAEGAARALTAVEQLRDGLVTAHGATLRRVFVRDGDEAVLVVLALPSERIAEEERRLGESTALNVKVIDPTTHESMLRLAEAGLIALPEGELREVWPASGPKRSESDGRILRAKALTDRAEHKLKAAVLLVGGGLRRGIPCARGGGGPARGRSAGGDARKAQARRHRVGRGVSARRGAGRGPRRPAARCDTGPVGRRAGGRRSGTDRGVRVPHFLDGRGHVRSIARRGGVAASAGRRFMCPHILLRAIRECVHGARAAECERRRPPVVESVFPSVDAERPRHGQVQVWRQAHGRQGGLAAGDTQERVAAIHGRHSRQETNLFPLTDFRPRRGVENLERAYLGGRYGAVPYVRPSRVGSDA